MNTKRKKTGRKLLSFLLTLAMVVGLMPGMSLTAYAETSYGAYLVTDSDTDETLTNKVVQFNGIGWYIIKDESLAENAGTITLLVQEKLGDTMSFDKNVNTYSDSAVKQYLDRLTDTAGDFAGVSEAIVSVEVKGSDTDTAVNAKLWLLSTDEADKLPVNVRKSTWNWWLRSTGGISQNGTMLAADVNNYTGAVSTQNIKSSFNVRPALKLDLSKVTFDSNTKTFSVGTPKSDQTVTAPTAASGLTYTGSAQTLISSAAKVITGNTSGSITYSLDGTDYSPDLPTGTNTGTYSVYYKVAGNDDYNEFVSTLPVSVTIAKATPTVTAPTATNPIYTGAAQDLITAGTTTGGEIQYSLDGSNYSKTIPQGTDKQEYTVYYKVVGNDNYNDVAAQTVKSTISDKSPATVNTAPQAKTLTYTGAAQELVTAGTATGGEMWYALGTKEAATEEYTSAIPTATDAGTYYVWYKAVGDSDHLDSNPECVVVKINEAEKEEVISDIESGEDKESEKEEVISDGDSSEETGFVKDVTEEISESTDSLKTKIENSSDLKAALDLKDDEITEGVRVWLYVRDAEGTAPEEDKELVQSTAGESTVGMYLDITLFNQVGGNDEVKVTETSKAIKASILIPESLRKSGRTFEIIRIHNGVATKIPGSYDESTGMFTFETDQFSTYALVYKDASESTDDTSEEPSGNTDAASDETSENTDVNSDETTDSTGEAASENENSEAAETAETVVYKVPEYPLYRLYNTRTGEHFFTMSEEERDYWIERSAETGWTSENIAWYVRKDTGIPVYRVFDANRTGQHRFTSDVNERDEYIKKGWVDEGIGWYSSGSDGKKVYKLKHPTAKKHCYHYTIYEEERDTLLAQGWTLEESGITGQ